MRGGFIKGGVGDACVDVIATDQGTARGLRLGIGSVCYVHIAVFDHGNRGLRGFPNGDEISGGVQVAKLIARAGLIEQIGRRKRRGVIKQTDFERRIQLHSPRVRLPRYHQHHAEKNQANTLHQWQNICTFSFDTHA